MKPKKHMTLFLVLPLLLTMTSFADEAEPLAKKVEPWEIIEIRETDQGSEIHVAQATPEWIKVPYFGLQHLSTLKGDPETVKAPYLLFTGKTCKSCDEDPSVFVVRAEGGKSTQFVYPGTIRESRNGSVLMTSRAFYGKCLTSTKNDVYVVFLREKIRKKRRLWRSVFIAEPGPEYLREKLIEYRLPSINHTLYRVRTKQCTEISGVNRKTARKFKRISTP